MLLRHHANQEACLPVGLMRRAQVLISRQGHPMTRTRIVGQQYTQRRRLSGAKIKRMKIRHCMMQNKRGKQGGRRMMREGVAERSTNLGRTRNERGGISRKTRLFHSCPSGRLSPQRKNGKGKNATNLIRYLLINVILDSLDFRARTA